MRENFTGRYTPSRHLAGHALRAWFQRLWRQDPRPEDLLKQIRDLLAEITLDGSYETREAVLLSVLEHLFVDPSVVAFFEDWLRNPTLNDVYHEALDLTR